MCESLFLTLKEKHRLKVLKNKVLRESYGLKRNEIIKGWRKLNNEEPCNLYSLPGKIGIIKIT
jgi:hypothetical protein